MYLQKTYERVGKAKNDYFSIWQYSKWKKTLAKKICSLYDFEYIPSRREELSFLDDFYENIPRFFLSAQSCFLISKAYEIHQRIAKGQNIVIDRSIQEDIYIFAQYWMDRYEIDEREKALYVRIANYVISTTPKSDACIYYKCSPRVSLERTSSRPSRSFEAKIPPDFIQDLNNYYSSFRFPSAHVIECDSEHLCFSDDSTVITIMKRILDQIKEGETE